MSTPVAGSLAVTPLYTVQATDAVVSWDDVGATWRNVAPWGTGGPFLPISGGTITGNITLTGAAPQITLNNGTQNWIKWPAVGLGAPQFTTSSPGTRLILWPAVGASSADYAIGMQSGALWFGVPATASSFAWYGGTAQVMTLSGAGLLTIPGNLTVSGTTTVSSGGIKYGAPADQFALTWNGSGTNLWVNGTNTGTITTGGPYLPLAGGSLSGALTVSGAVSSTGGGASFLFLARDNASVSWQWYAQSNAARLYYSAIGDMMVLDTSGNIQLAGYGIQYAGTYGSAHKIGFGYGTYPGFTANVAVSVNNGAAVYPIANASDERMKFDIAPATYDCLDTVRRLPLHQFRWRDIPHPGRLKAAKTRDDAPLTRVGLVAQRLYEVYPQGAVKGDGHDDRLGVVWGIDHNNMIALLVGAVQQLTAQVEALKARA